MTSQISAKYQLNLYFIIFIRWQSYFYLMNVILIAKNINAYKTYRLIYPVIKKRRVILVNSYISILQLLLCTDYIQRTCLQHYNYGLMRAFDLSDAVSYFIKGEIWSREHLITQNRNYIMLRVLPVIKYIKKGKASSCTALSSGYV